MVPRDRKRQLEQLEREIPEQPHPGELWYGDREQYQPVPPRVVYGTVVIVCLAVWVAVGYLLWLYVVR